MNPNPAICAQFMKIRRNEIVQNLSTILGTATLLILFAGSRVLAQTAPPFSNDLMMDNKTYTFFIADRLEYRSISGADPLIWDVQGWIGKDYHKFWFKTEGEALTAEKEGEMEFHGLYSRAITSYFDLQAGIRYDVAYERSVNRSRGFAIIGLQGLAPYFFEVDASLLISEVGNLSASFEGEYDFPITQRLFGQPRFETRLALQEVEKFGEGAGFNEIELGFRFRYEIRREFAPYLGISWERKLAATADFARLDGEEVSTLSLLGGFRVWF